MRLVESLESNTAALEYCVGLTGCPVVIKVERALESVREFRICRLMSSIINGAQTCSERDDPSIESEVAMVPNRAMPFHGQLRHRHPDGARWPTPR